MASADAPEKLNDAERDLDRQTKQRLARRVLIAFLATFMAARIVVFLIMSRAIPELFLHLGGTHVHHLNYGIFLLAGVGAYLIFQRPSGRRLRTGAIVYGIGLALTFDEFGMWLHFGRRVLATSQLRCDRRHRGGARIDRRRSFHQAVSATALDHGRHHDVGPGPVRRALGTLRTLRRTDVRPQIQTTRRRVAAIDAMFGDV